MRRRELVRLLGGAAIVRPFAAQAQQKARPVIGYLSSTSPDHLSAYRRGLSEMGYIEGQNVTIEYRSAGGRVDLLPALAAELAGRKVDLIAAFGGSFSARAAREATSSIPVTFLVGIDPVANGLVASLARPGGNLTGISLLIRALYPKRVELLSELVPRAKSIALLVNPNGMNTQGFLGEVQDAARVRSVQIDILRAASQTEIETAFEDLVQRHTDALIVSANPFFDTQRNQLLALAARHEIPTIYAWRDFVAAGGLISYGASLAAVNRQLGIYAGKILNGVKPADLPVQQPTTFELAINLKTAKTLGLALPQSLLARADEIIE
jgi:putative ABC transport system substrate-binding protein